MDELDSGASKACHRDWCHCNCCDKRNNKHCREHGNDCHLRCPY